ATRCRAYGPDSTRQVEVGNCSSRSFHLLWNTLPRTLELYGLARIRAVAWSSDRPWLHETVAASRSRPASLDREKIGSMSGKHTRAWWLVKLPGRPRI